MIRGSIAGYAAGGDSEGISARSRFPEAFLLLSVHPEECLPKARNPVERSARFLCGIAV